MTRPQKTPPTARAGSRDDPTNPVPEAEGGGELIERVARAICAQAGDNPDRVEMRFWGGSTGFVPVPRWLHSRGAARAAISALSSEAPPVVCGGEDGSARADGAEPGSQERAAVVPDAVLAGADMANQLRGWARDMFSVAGIDEDDRAWLFEVAIALEGAERAAVVPAAEQAGGWRPEVLAFADLMERTLRANDHKGGWKRDPPHALLKRLSEEVGELATELNSEREQEWSPWDPATQGSRVKWRQAVRSVTNEGSGGYETRPLGNLANRLHPTPEWRARLASEAADVANFAMMVADVCGALPPPDHDAIPSAEGGSGKDTREADKAIHQRVGELADALDRVLTWAEENGSVEWPDYDELVNDARALLQSPRGEA